jgi:predicted nucleotide-binding protein (sugar kinase/HSP70/actin superfamily)
MGAYGTALLLRKMFDGGDGHERLEGTGFRGFAFIDAEVALSESTCRYCTNYCTITSASIEGENRDVSWGYLCGRDPDDTKRKKCEEFRLMELRERLLMSYGTSVDGRLETVGIPRALTTYSNFPLWAVFFRELGYNVKLSRPTDEDISSSGVHISGAEFCHPTRISVGHVLSLLEDESIDYVFVPSHLETFRIGEVTKSWYCPLVIQNPYYTRASLCGHRDAGKIVSASINFNWPLRNIEEELTDSFGATMGLSGAQLTAAWQKAIAAQREFEEKCQELGRRSIEELEESGRDCIVIVGRPYTVFDYGMNLNMPKRIAEYGYPVIPLEFIPYNEETREELKEAYWNLYWAYGQRILNAIEYIRKAPNLYPVCFTNFKCGPDSYVLTYVEASIREKPLLTLEFDEHNSSGGYITRLEAFFDTIRNNPVKTCPKYEAAMVIKDIFDVDRKEPIYIMHSPDNMTAAYAAVFRGYGFNAQVCPPVDEEMYNRGRAFTRGSECSPAVEMVSNYLAVLDSSDSTVFHFAMPDSTGPCRMGQYSYLYNVIFKHFADREINFVNAQISIDTKDSINPEIKKNAYRGMVVLDLLQKSLHKTRPYEREKGRSLATYRDYRKRVLDALERGGPLEPVFVEAVEAFKRIEIDRARRPLVGIVGEYFVTTSAFINQNLIEVIEECGGEAWLVPHADFTLWYSVKDFQVLHKLRPFDREGILKQERTVEFLQGEEHRLIALSGGFLDRRSEPSMREIYREAMSYMHEDVPNETLPTVGRAVLFAKRDGASLIVNCKPFSCMPGNASEAILQRVKRDYDIPVVNVNYEGTGDANKSVRTMLLNLT